MRIVAVLQRCWLIVTMSAVGERSVAALSGPAGLAPLGLNLGLLQDRYVAGR